MQPCKSNLTQERNNEIAHAIAVAFLRENFRLVPNGDYRRKLGNAAATIGGNVTIEELNGFILDKLPEMLGQMFGFAQCGIFASGTRS